jgi:hypothetical protein
MAPMAKMLGEVVSFVLHHVKTLASKTVSRLCHKNGNADDRPPLLKLAYLARAAVQHAGVKQGNYDASLYFFGGFDNAADVRHALAVHDGIFDTVLQPWNTTFAELRQNILIHNKYYCNHTGCRW